MLFVFLRDITVYDHDKEWGDSDLDVDTTFQDKFDSLEEVYDFIWKSFKANKSKPIDMSRFTTKIRDGNYPTEIAYNNNPLGRLCGKSLWEYDVYNILI